MSTEEHREIAENLFMGNSALGALLRSHDWSQTPLGAVETWSECLKTAVQVLLSEIDQVNQQEKMHVEQVEATLHQSEERYRMLFESIDEGFCIVEVLFDADGESFDHRIVQANPAFERQSGIANPEGKRASELAPGLEQYWNDLYAQVIHTGESTRIERYANALNRWFNVQVSRIGDGSAGLVAVVFTDISEHKKAEAVLNASNETLRHLVVNSPFGVYIVDDDFRLVQVSAGAQKVFANIHPLIGRDFAEILRIIWVEPFASEAIALFQRTLETGEPYHSPSTVEHRYDISEVESYDWKIERITLPDGRFGVVCHFYDLSERQRYETELHESEERFRNMADNAPGMVWMSDPTGYCTYLSQSWYSFTGQTEETGLGFGRLSRVHPDDYEVAERTFLNAREQQAAFRLEYRLQRKDGAYIWAIDTASPWFGMEGQFRGHIGSVLDISELKQAEAERERLLQQEKAARAEAECANRVKDEFLAVLSHELRSPLNPILGWAQLLQNSKLDEATRAKALKTIEHNAELQSQLIDDLLDISCIMQGKLSLTVASVSLAFVISAAVETVRLAAEAKQIEITLNLNPTLGPTSGDTARLQQVVWNLLNNAVKFTPNGGQITVELNQINHLAQIRVIDTGKGINPDFLPHVFEYFRQEDGSTTRRFGGLGLGLAIVRQIVERHGGMVWAESEGKNQGATFIVQLPTLQQTISIGPKRTQFQIGSERRLNNLKILLVEDDTDTREFQTFLLEQDGATVIATATALEALQKLDQLIPDVIVSDIGMAEINGYMLMQQIRSRAPNQGGTVPAIALTAYAAEIDKERALQAGFQKHLKKPLEPEQFVSTILSLLQPNQV